jgi:MFS transporter, DHA3 family, tetracycline resistance protein
MAAPRVSGSRAPAVTLASAGAEARVSALAAFLRPLHERNFRLLVLGQSQSTFGDFLFVVAFPFLLLEGGVGPKGLGLVFTLLGAARLAGTPIGGILADRWHPRVTMIAADLGRAAALLWLASSVERGAVPLWQFGIVGVVLGAFEGPFIPAYRAITPALLPKDQLRAGNSVGQTANVAAAITGQLVAGVAVATLGAASVLRIDVVTFAVSAVTLLAMTPSQAEPGRAERGGAQARQAGVVTAPITQARASVSFRSFVLHSRLVLVILLMTAMVSITAAGLFAVGLPIFAKQRFPNAAEMYGVLLVATAIGRLGGSVAAGVLIGGRNRGLVALAVLVVHGAVLVALPGLGGLPSLLPALAILGLADGTLSVVVVTLMQQLTPREILGRVMALLALVQTSSFPVSVALAGLFVALWGVQSAFVLGGLGVLAVALFGFTQTVVREA